MNHASFIRRFLSACLAVMIVGGVFCTASCSREGNDEEVPHTESEMTGEGSQAEETATGKAYDTVKKEQFNRDFCVLNRKDYVLRNEFCAEKYNGEIMNDAIYERNVTISKDFGIEFKITEMYTGEVNEMVRKQVRGNLNDYHLYVGHKYSYSLAESNQLYDMRKISAIDLDGGWWDHAYIDNTAVGGRVYTAISDVNVDSLGMSSCLSFNKRMMDDMGKAPDSLHATVKEGKWTLDRMIELCADVSRDLDSDGEWTENDQYGMSAWLNDAPYSYLYGCGCRYVVFDEDQLPVLDYDTEKVIDVYGKIYQLTIGEQAYFMRDVPKHDSVYEMFHDGKVLFCNLTPARISVFLTGSVDPYGIIPIPKYDEIQKEYLAFVNGDTKSLMIAKNEPDPEFVGTIVNAMSCYNYDHVTPLLFEVVTKLHAAQDPQSAEMVDYIVRNRIHDFAYCAGLGLGEMVRDQLVNKSESIARKLKSLDSSDRGKLKRIIQRFNQCD